MSSTGQANIPPGPLLPSNRIIDALADYTKVAGVDLSNNPLAVAIEQSNSPEDILELLQEREKAFREYRDGNRRLISCLRPAVKVIHSFSSILGEAVSLVSHTCHLAILLVISSDPVPTSQRLVRSDRYSPYCTSLRICIFNRFPCDECVHARLLVGSRQVMMPFSSCSSVWETSSSGWKFIRRFRLLRY